MPVRRIISLVQQGILAQNEFAKFLMMGSGGLLEISAPLTDEERRDFEVHVIGHYGWPLAFQVKSVLELTHLSKNALYLRSFLKVRASRVVNDPHFYYFWAYLDPVKMAFADPTFLIPASVFHEHASPIRKGDFWAFTFEASMEPDSKDKWHTYRVNVLELGQRVLAITRELRRTAGASPEASRLLHMPGIVWAHEA
jgi:hypothetical protein